MTVQEVLDHFGGVAPTANALGISYQAVRQWSEKGEVPEGRQWELHFRTNGALKADDPKDVATAA